MGNVVFVQWQNGAVLLIIETKEKLHFGPSKYSRVQCISDISAVTLYLQATLDITRSNYMSTNAQNGLLGLGLVE